MRESGIQLQWPYQQHVNAAAERERRTNQTYQKMQQAYQDERQKVLDQKSAFDWERQFFTEQSRNTQRQMQLRLNAFSEREREMQQNDALRNLTQQRENDRRERMRSEWESLQSQLGESNKPGFLRRWWNKIF